MPKIVLLFSSSHLFYSNPSFLRTSNKIKTKRYFSNFHLYKLWAVANPKAQKSSNILTRSGSTYVPPTRASKFTGTETLTNTQNNTAYLLIHTTLLTKSMTSTTTDAHKTTHSWRHMQSKISKTPPPTSAVTKRYSKSWQNISPSA